MIIGNLKIHWEHHNERKNQPSLSKLTRKQIKALLPSYTVCTIETVDGSNGIVLKAANDTTTTVSNVSVETHLNPKDNYNHKLGRKMTFTGVVSSLADKATRKELWEAFFKMSPKCINC